MYQTQIIIYILLLAVVVYAVALIGKRYARIKDYRHALLAFSFMAMFGPAGEIFVGTIYHALTGDYLWQYQIHPLHHGYTSLIAPLLWGTSGLYIHLFWGWLEKVRNGFVRYGLYSIEIIVVEFFLNGSFLLLTGGYIFFYHPPDLLHLTSLITIPFYIVAARAIVSSLKYAKSQPMYFTVLFLFMAVALMLMATA